MRTGRDDTEIQTFRKGPMAETLLTGSDAQARLCQNLNDPPLGRAAWNRLLAQSETRSVFLTWQWLATWWECFGEGATLFAFAVERDGELVGVAPLAVRREHGQRIVEFLGMGSSDYCDVIATADDKPVVVRAVMEALLKRRDRWDRIRLRYLPAASSTAGILASLPLPSGWQIVQEVESTCPALSIESSRPFAEACARKKSLVRHARYFERLAPLRFRHVLDPDEILDRLPDFIEQHRDRRFMAGDHSIFDDPRHRRFYERMIPAMLEGGALRFGVLEWRDEVLAYHLGFFHDGVFTWYKPTFNVDWARYSPGEVLLKALLEAALETDVRVFDFTVGDEAFKERFANVKAENLKVQIVRNVRRSPRERIGEDLKRWLKTRHPELFLQLKTAQRSLHQAAAQSDNLSEVVSTFKPGQTAPVRRRTRAPLGAVSRILWRAAPQPAVPSEFSAVWARYSHLKLLTRREGLHQQFLLACLEKLRRGERAVVVLWQDRPVSLVWLARDAAAEVQSLGYATALPEGAAVVTDSYLALDLRGSPRRETLPATILTFLAAEGVTALYGIQDTRHAPPVLAACGSTLVPLERRLDIQAGRWTWRRDHRFAT
jgi:CelD/BcsL family acetyltransferase involved in cellulose biosynthesis